MLEDYFEDEYLKDWRTFISRTHKSNPFNELWGECCQQFYGKQIILQIDTPTRWSSSVMMLSKAVTVKQAVERMHHITSNPNGNAQEHHVCFWWCLYS